MNVIRPLHPIAPPQKNIQKTGLLRALTPWTHQNSHVNCAASGRCQLARARVALEHAQLKVQLCRSVGLHPVEYSEIGRNCGRVVSWIVWYSTENHTLRNILSHLPIIPIIPLVSPRYLKRPCQAKTLAHDPHLRYSAVGASAGAAIVGAGGAATGLTTGSLLGAAVGRSIWATLLVSKIQCGTSRDSK